DLREQTRRLEEAPRATPDALAPAAAAAPNADPAVAELRARIDTLQRRIDQVAGTPAQPRPATTPGTRQVPASAPTVTAPARRTSAAPAPVRPAHQIDEVEREVREMQEVIRMQRLARQHPSPPAHPAIRIAVPAPRAAGTSTIADPLAPLVSKTQPRIAPAPKGMSSTALVSWAPSSPTARQDAAPGAPEPRYTRVGINSGVQRFGPLALPFDAIGNLFAAIGEGLDRLFTGRVYLDRPADDSAQARR
ncbi:MAG TPA: hypothetical protein VFF65_05345, partial [Phycisphaerales bacterium]|nr:hypothetical protein [Phycisphaerales bacterium]